MKCPYCGSKNLTKTFNFNEYNCLMCECYFKPTTSGIKIFQDGSWKKFCESVYENIKKYINDANYINFIHNVTQHYAKSGPENIDLLVEEYEKLAINLLNEHKIGLRNKEDFNVVYKEIVRIVECARTLYKRSDELNIKIKLTEEMKDFIGDEENELKIAEDISNKVIEYLRKNNQEINDENIIKFINNKYPQHKDLLHSIINFVKEKLNFNDEEDISEENTENDKDFISENVFYEEENKQENSQEDNEIDSLDVENSQRDDENQSDDNEDEEDSDEESSLSDIKSEIEDLKNKLNSILDKINASEGGEGEDSNQTEENSDFSENDNVTDAAEDNDSTENNQSFESSESLEDEENTENSENNSNIKESENKKLTANRSGYKRKISNRDAEKKNPFQTDMTAEEEDEEIPFTVRERTRMKKLGMNTENDISNGILKNTDNKPVYAYKPGDSVFVEGFKEPLVIKKINGNIFTLEKGKFSTRINVNETKIRHADRNLEWETESKQIRTLQKKWDLLKNLYLKEQDESLKVAGIVGLGGGNRLGGEKFDQEPIIDDPQDNTVYYNNNNETREKIYQFIKDKNIHKMNREAAVEYLLNTFVNSREEIETILDDAILSLDPSKENIIDANYNYNQPKSGLDLHFDLKKKWNGIEQQEIGNTYQTNNVVNKPIITPYESPEDEKLNDLDKSYKNILKDV